jgi:hypothetical protein
MQVDFSQGLIGPDVKACIDISVSDLRPSSDTLWPSLTAPTTVMFPAASLIFM